MDLPGLRFGIQGLGFKGLRPSALSSGNGG